MCTQTETSNNEHQASVQTLGASSRPLLTHEINSFSADSRETDSLKTKDCRRGLEPGPSGCWRQREPPIQGPLSAL